MDLDDETQGEQTALPAADEAMKLFSAEDWEKVAKHLRLTPRQVAVAELLCAECSQKDMARELGLSMDTIRTHLRGLYQRLHVRSRVGVVVRLVLAQRELTATPVAPTATTVYSELIPTSPEDGLTLGRTTFQ